MADEPAQRNQSRDVEQVVLFACPECGERLFLSISADGGEVTVMRQRDVPRESDNDGGDDA